MCIPGIGRLYQKVHKKFAKIAKPLTLLTRQQVKFKWTPEHQVAFMKLKDSVTQVPILCYPNPSKKYIIYTVTSDDACRAQLTQEHDGMEFPIAFLSHTFSETQKKWSTTEQEAYGVYYAITKWNYYLQGANITVRNDHNVTHVKGILYKHITDSGQKFLALVIPKSWKYMVLGEAHDKMGHQGNTHTYCLIKCQYYWKGMNKDIHKYIANCVLC